MHEWSYEGRYPPIITVDEEGIKEEKEPTENIVTWVYEEGSFVPCCKFIDSRHYSIISDYLSTPTHFYDETGKPVWERELDIYGAVRKEVGEKGFVPQLYQGQYVDEETGLAYNRFRYYDSDAGNYISQDPIGLAGGNPTMYGYVFDSNTEIDPFGLECHKKIQSEITEQTKRTESVVQRWLKSSDNKWAQEYRRFETTNPNFAKLIKGRIIDRRMNDWMTKKYGDLFPGSSFDKTIPGSGRMRPDAYFPDLNGKSAIFDIGGSSKATGIGKYDGLADIVEPIIY